MATVEEVNKRKKQREKREKEGATPEELAAEGLGVGESQSTDVDASGQTPEERKAAGQEFIQEREKLASQLGISSKAAGRALVDSEQAALNQRLGQQAVSEETEFFKEQAPIEKGEAQLRGERVQGEIAVQEGTLQGLAPEKFRIFARTKGLETEGIIAESLIETAEIISMAQKINPFKADKKLQSTKDVEETFNRGADALIKEIANLKTGKGDRVAARQNIRMMRSAVSQLNSKMKAIQNSELKYWLKDGKVIEEDIIIFQQLLNELELEAIQASAGVLQ